MLLVLKEAGTCSLSLSFERVRRRTNSQGRMANMVLERRLLCNALALGSVCDLLLGAFTSHVSKASAASLRLLCPPGFPETQRSLGRGDKACCCWDKAGSGAGSEILGEQCLPPERLCLEGPPYGSTLLSLSLHFLKSTSSSSAERLCFFIVSHTIESPVFIVFPLRIAYFQAHGESP